MRDRTCADCGAEAPETDTMHTLYTPRYGWRLTREPTSSGEMVLKLRCPACWSAYKAQGGVSSSSASWPQVQGPASGLEADEGPSEAVDGIAKRLRGSDPREGGAQSDRRK